MIFQVYLVPELFVLLLILTFKESVTIITLSYSTSPLLQMGYGSRTLQLLLDYYEGKFPSLNEDTEEAPVQLDTEVVYIIVIKNPLNSTHLD